MEQKGDQRKQEALDYLTFKQHYCVEKFLDEGGQAWVYKVVKDKIPYAAKIVDLERFQHQKSNVSKEDQFKQMLNEEIRLVQALDHNKNIVEAPVEQIYTGKACYLIQKFYNRGNLQNYLEQYAESEEIPDEGTIAHVIGSVVRGLVDIHRINIVHSDLKIQNILIHDPSDQEKTKKNAADLSHCEIAICDFGFAIMTKRKYDDLEVAKGGSLFYYSPEQLFNDIQQVSKASDIWAIGVITHLLVFKRYPFLNQILNQDFGHLDPEVKNLQVNAEKIPNIDLKLFRASFKKLMKEKKLQLNIQESRPLSIELINFIDKCFKLDPSKRSTAEELLNHPFVRKQKSGLFIKNPFEISFIEERDYFETQ
ncbi:protein kinase domain containing protein [Stylonychia lemnae]|uniref:Protein kinase domain containing protein n=1 Tax=Stylonychia lemnae TaxID=5949 RepID=A0A078B6L0_STYLE|nr:protein kinase domain containing protein [Stylonychia lemnae]|eukprot:CDW90170.1 protein kinase domain containing protein [Stylonychia lemnae]